MYRTMVKTTKKTANKCLDCKHCLKLDKGYKGYFVKCNAPDKVFSESFDARDYTCKENKSWSDLKDTEIENMRKTTEKKLSDSLFSKWAKTYYPKDEARRMIDKRKGK